MTEQRMKIQKTLYIDLDVYQRAKRVYGERHVSNEIQRLLELDLYKTEYECRKCKSHFKEFAWRRHSELHGRCISCHSTDLMMVS